MNVIKLNDLSILAIEKQYNYVVNLIKENNFQAAGLRRIKPTHYYVAELDKYHTLLLKFVTYRNEKYALVLDIIYRYDICKRDGEYYKYSNFLSQLKVKNVSLRYP